MVFSWNITQNKGLNKQYFIIFLQMNVHLKARTGDITTAGNHILGT